MVKINIEDKYLDVIDRFQEANKSEIELKFKKSDRQMAIQYIILEFMKENYLTHYLNTLQNDKENK